jgi:exopolysaccharide production protein ExoZ
VVALSGSNFGPAGYYLRSICLEFGVGLACAWWVRRSAGALAAPVWFAILAAGVLGFVAGMTLDHTFRWAGVLCALGAGAIIVALVRLEQAGKLRAPSLFVVLGGASYAIYLVHFSAITVLAAVVRALRLPATDAVCLACAVGGVVAGVLFDRIADRPIQRWLRRRKVEMLPRPVVPAKETPG